MKNEEKFQFIKSNENYLYYTIFIIHLMDYIARLEYHQAFYKLNEIYILYINNHVQYYKLNLFYFYIRIYFYTEIYIIILFFFILVLFSFFNAI